MGEILRDEVAVVSEEYCKALLEKQEQATFLFIYDDQAIGVYYKAVFTQIEASGIAVKALFMSLETEDKNTEHIAEVNGIGQLQGLEKAMWRKPIVTTLMLNLKKRCYEDPKFRERALNVLREVTAAQCLNTQHRLILSCILPDLPAWEGPITHLAEMELSAVLAQCAPKSVGRLLAEMEREVADAKLETKWFCLRFDHVFGPGIENFQLTKFFDDLRMTEENTDGIRVVDNGEFFSCTYIRDIMLAHLRCQLCEEASGVYNVDSYNATRTDIAFSAFKQFSNGSSQLEIMREGDTRHHSLETLKAQSAGWQSAITLEEAVYRSICARHGVNYLMSRSAEIYHGRLELLKKLEVEILKEVDKICKANGIRYFLVGGSLLGAVRHQGFIPWDDDLDIGMLRKDFEKFRKICPKVLPEKYIYQSYRTQPKSHYIFDKIRLKDTFFSTIFSRRFPIENGVFVDVLVYDKTAKSRVLQKLHIRLIEILKQVINVRWVNEPRRGFHYIATVICLPFMRLIPFGVYHAIFEMLIRVFNRSNSGFYIDSVGMNLRRGAFRKECIIGEVQYVPFEDVRAPIPPGWDEYLRHWYGENYMQFPNISSRTSGHKIAQMDLGKKGNAYIHE